LRCSLRSAPLKDSDPFANSSKRARLWLDSSSARALPRPLTSRSHRRQQRKKRNPSFLSSSLGLFLVYETYPHSYTIKYTIMCTWIR
jgi:hypothetical protein